MSQEGGPWAPWNWTHYYRGLDKLECETAAGAPCQGTTGLALRWLALWHSATCPPYPHYGVGLLGLGNTTYITSHVISNNQPQSKYPFIKGNLGVNPIIIWEIFSVYLILAIPLHSTVVLLRNRLTTFIHHAYGVCTWSYTRWWMGTDSQPRHLSEVFTNSGLSLLSLSLLDTTHTNRPRCLQKISHPTSQRPSRTQQPPHPMYSPTTCS